MSFETSKERTGENQSTELHQGVGPGFAGVKDEMGLEGQADSRCRCGEQRSGPPPNGPSPHQR